MKILEDPLIGISKLYCGTVERLVEVGKRMTSFPEIGHCYQRPTFKGWPYNLFAMIHGKSRDALNAG